MEKPVEGCPISWNVGEKFAFFNEKLCKLQRPGGGYPGPCHSMLIPLFAIAADLHLALLTGRYQIRCRGRHIRCKYTPPHANQPHIYSRGMTTKSPARKSPEMHIWYLVCLCTNNLNVAEEKLPFAMQMRKYRSEPQKSWRLESISYVIYAISLFLLLIILQLFFNKKITKEFSLEREYRSLQICSWVFSWNSMIYELLKYLHIFKFCMIVKHYVMHDMCCKRIF